MALRSLLQLSLLIWSGYGCSPRGGGTPRLLPGSYSIPWPHGPARSEGWPPQRLWSIGPSRTLWACSKLHLASSIVLPSDGPSCWLCFCLQQHQLGKMPARQTRAKLQTRLIAVCSEFGSCSHSAQVAPRRAGSRTMVLLVCRFLVCPFPAMFCRGSST